LFASLEVLALGDVVEILIYQREVRMVQAFGHLQQDGHRALIQRPDDSGPDALLDGVIRGVPYRAHGHRRFYNRGAFVKRGAVCVTPGRLLNGAPFL